MRSTRTLVLVALLAACVAFGGTRGSGAPELAAGMVTPLGEPARYADENRTPARTASDTVAAEDPTPLSDRQSAAGGAELPQSGAYLAGSGFPQQPLPEPETVSLFLIGAVAVVGLLWRRGYLTLPETSRT